MANPPISSLQDVLNEAAVNTAVWNGNAGTITMVPALPMAQIPCPTGTGVTNQLAALGPYDCTAGALYARVTPILRGAGGTQSTMGLQLNANNSVAMRLDGGMLKLVVTTAGVGTTVTLPAYDPTQHAWWRLREQAGTWYAEASSDGYAWTTLGSATYSWSPTALQVLFQTSATVTQSAGLFMGVAQVNMVDLPGGLMPSWPQVRFGVAFNSNGTLSTQPAYADLTSRLRGSWSAQMSGRQYELDQIQSGQLSVSLWNLDGALDPTNSSSPYWPNVQPLKPCRLQAVWPSGSRNLLDQQYSTGTAPASAWYPWLGSVAPATGLSAAPTGHTTAIAWTFPASAAANGYPLVTGSTGSNAESASIPVTAGTTYTWSGWLSRSTGGDTTINMQAYIIWYGLNGTEITQSGTAVTTVPVTPNWVQMTATASAPAGALFARVALYFNTATTTATDTIYLTGMQFEAGSAATPWTPGGRIYPLWSGFAERWPQQWDYSGTYGLVDATAVDALAGLAQFTLQPSLEANLLSLNPDRLYPLDDPQGSTGFRDITGKHGTGNLLHSPYGAGTITFGNSVQGTGFTGAAGPIVTLANPAPAATYASAGSWLNLGAPNGPPVSGGWTRIICFRTTTVPSSGTYMTLWGWQANSAANQSIGGLFINSSQNVFFQTGNAAGQGMTSSVPTVSVCDGNWHMACIILTADGKTLNVNVDGVGFTATSSSNCQPSGISWDTIGMAVSEGTSEYYYPYSGDLAYAVEIPTNLVPSFSDLASGFSTGWAGETSVKRAQRILSMAGSGLPLVAEGTNTLMGGANLAGTDAMSALNVVGDSEAGQVWADASGNVRLDGRLWRYLQNTATITFGEQQNQFGLTGGEVPYLTDLSLDYDDTHIYNATQVTNQVAPGATQPPAATYNNTASQAAFLPRSLQRTINTNDQTAPLSQAAYLAVAYGNPLARVATLTVDGASNPALWQQILPLTFGTRANVNRRPPPGPGAAAISLAEFIEQLTWSGDDQGNLKLALELTPAAPFTGWGVVAPLHSTLQSQANSATNTITLGALTGSASNPAAAVLALGTQLVVGYGTSVAETVTVQSVAATSPGYTSVVVTLTANLANTHASGSVVTQPLPSGYTLPAQVAAAYPGSMDAGATLSATGPRVSY